MGFTLFAAADLWGTKINYEFPFPDKPSPLQLQQAAAAVFAAESAARRPAAVPAAHAFQLDRLQTFDERSQSWVDLRSPQQLQEGSQVYVFQLESAHHQEQQSTIPPPVALPASAQAQLANQLSAIPALPAGYSPAPSPPPPPPPVVAAALSPCGALRGRTLPSGEGAGGRPAEWLSPVPRPPAPARPQPAPPPAAAADGPGRPARADPAGAPSAPRAPPQPAPDVPHREKVLAVFSALTPPGRRGFEIDHFRELLMRLRCDITGAAAAELFVRADADGDNVVVEQEWGRFCELFPALLDCLYFRSRDSEAEGRLEAAITEARARLERVRDREQELRLATISGASEAAECTQRLAAHDGAAQAAEAREEEARAALGAARGEAERARDEVRACTAALGTARDDERRQGLAVQEAGRAVELARRQLQQQSIREQQKAEEIRALERRLEELRGQLKEAQAAVDRAHHGVAAAEAEEQVAAELLKERQRGTQQHQQQVAACEEGVAMALQRQQQAEQAVHEAEALGRQEAVQRRRLEEELAHAQAREQQQHAAVQEAGGAVAEQEAALRQLERELVDTGLRRRQQEEDERPLLEQERRLVAQREALAEEERRLRSEHRSFHSVYGRGTPAADTPSASPIEEGHPAAALPSPVPPYAVFSGTAQPAAAHRSATAIARSPTPTYRRSATPGRGLPPVTACGAAAAGGGAAPLVPPPVGVPIGSPRTGAGRAASPSRALSFSPPQR
eukprot:TRINITY_DN10201_c0_g1_i2.p1 TRINITY_DN10201_c0_g1~~TRINITY_DN10201_c0_g1_i2.p1  ORF type:complete len:765 (+),score=281.34 TRINITY_DN10201_c0_g1_i2:79-2295(+)